MAEFNAFVNISKLVTMTRKANYDLSKIDDELKVSSFRGYCMIISDMAELVCRSVK